MNQIAACMMKWEFDVRFPALCALLRFIALIALCLGQVLGASASAAHKVGMCEAAVQAGRGEWDANARNRKTHGNEHIPQRQPHLPAAPAPALAPAPAFYGSPTG